MVPMRYEREKKEAFNSPLFQIERIGKGFYINEEKK